MYTHLSKDYDVHFSVARKEYVYTQVYTLHCSAFWTIAVFIRRKRLRVHKGRKTDVSEVILRHIRDISSLFFFKLEKKSHVFLRDVPHTHWD